MKNLSLKGFSFALLLAAFVAFGAFDSRAQTVASKQLFRFGETPRAVANRAASEKASIAAVRESLIDVRVSAADLRQAAALEFELFDNRIYKAIRHDGEGLETRGANDVTWRGAIAGAPDSSVTLTLKAGALSGLIFTSAGVYEIVRQNDKQILIEIDQSRFPACAGGIEAAPNEKSDSPANNRNALVGADSSDRIDVLVVYTTALKNAIGAAAAQNLAQQAVDISNTTYLNSRVRQRVRLASAQEAVGYTEAGNTGADLTWVRNDAGIAALRNQFNADLVALITNAASDACGRGYVMTNVSTAFAPNAFTVTARSCAIGNLSFTHELGHNMGSQHNPENGGNAAFSFAFGHYVNAQFRTVMSYVDPCPNGCTRVPYFSNPLVSYNNLPTGIENARDNARSLDLTADTIANLRYSGSSITLNQPNGNNIWLRNVPRRVLWTSDNVADEIRIELSRDGGRTFQILVAETANDGEETITIGGGTLKNARLRVVSVTNSLISDSSVAGFAVR